MAGILATHGPSARAQSSVTLYGLLDAGISYTGNNGGKKLVQFADGVYTGNRWGMVGYEDLGGGTRAIFRLESGTSGRHANGASTTVSSRPSLP